MSISIVTEPDEVCLVRQPAPLVVSTNDYITTAGVKSKSYLEFTGDCTNNQTFQIVCDGKTMIFTCKTSPTLSTHFPVNSGSPLDDYAQEIVNAITAYDLLTEIIDVTVDPSSTSILGKIKFEARTAGTTFNVTLTEALSNCTQTGYTAGVAEVVRAGMKITMDVYAEDVAGSYDFELAAQMEADVNSVGVASFFLNRVLHDYSTSRHYVPAHTLTGKALTGILKNYYTVLAEKYGSPPTLHNTYNSTHIRKKYILGGYNYGEAITNDFTDDYITDANGKKFLTKRTGKRVTRKAQQELLYCYVNAGLANMKISVTAWDMDNTSYGAAVIYATYTGSGGSGYLDEGVYCFSVGYTALDVETMFGGPVLRYKVKVTFATGTTTTEEIEYVVDRSHYYTNETFYYVNGFGCTETLWVRGEIIEKPMLDRQQAQRLRLYNDGADVSEYHDTNPTHRRELTVNVGYFNTYEDSAWMIDVLNTTQLWWYRNAQMQPLQVLTKEMAPYTTKQNVRELVINCIEAFDNNTI